MSVYSGFATR